MLNGFTIDLLSMLGLGGEGNMGLALTCVTIRVYESEALS